MTNNKARLGVAELPDPRTSPTVPLWPTAGQALGLSKNPTYKAAERGEIPVLRFGRSLRVPTAKLLEMLGQGGRQEAS